MSTAESSRPSPVAAKSERPAPTWALPAAGGLSLSLAAWVYARLFFPADTGTLAVEGDEFFFEINEAAGAPVLILSAWLFYRRSHLRDVLNGPGAPLPAALVFGATIGLFAWGTFTQAPDLRLATAIGLVFGTLLLWGGGAAVRAYWVPTLFLAFALPISPVLVSALIWPLQLVTAQYAGLLLNAIGAASIVQGDQILRPENNFIVIETCSGLRGVVTLTMLTVLLIDLFERRGRHALLLLLLAPVVALLTNGLRVVSLVLNPHSEVASIHSLQGIVMLLIGLLVLYGIDALLERGLRASASTERSAGYGSIRPPAVLTPGRGAALAGPALVLLALVVIEAAVPPWNAHRVLERTVDDRVVEALAGWRSRPISPDYRFRGGIHFQSWSRRGVALDGGEVDLLVGLANPGNRKLSAFSRRMARPSSGYEKVAEISAPVAPGAPPARRLELTRGATRVISFAWYEPEPGFANEFVRHALALERSPFARPRAAVAIRLATRIERGESEREAEARLARVYDRIAPVVAVLGRASPSP